MKKNQSFHRAACQGTLSAKTNPKNEFTNSGCKTMTS